MAILFYLSALIAVLATLLVITARNAIHALLYLIVSLLSVAMVFYVLGAPLVAALEVIIYAGAILVLFVFVTMMLNVGPQTAMQEYYQTRPQAWIGPAVLALVLMVELVYVLWHQPALGSPAAVVPAKVVGIALLGPYLLGLEMASVVLLSGLIGAYHLGRRLRQREEMEEGDERGAR